MPDDVITKVELRQMLGKVKMKKDDEPSILFEPLSAIENRFNKPGEQIPDDDLIAAVLRHQKNMCRYCRTAKQRYSFALNGFGVSHDSTLATNNRNAKYSRGRQ
jgi:hypothetical protein